MRIKSAVPYITSCPQLRTFPVRSGDCLLRLTLQIKRLCFIATENDIYATAEMAQTLFIELVKWVQIINNDCFDRPTRT
jgi:hypothetical protein